MRQYFPLFALVAVLCLLIVPASAEYGKTLTAENVEAYSFTADDGYVIYQIIVDSLPIGTNQTHELIYNGQPFELQVETWTDWAIWKNARVTLTFPNGTQQIKTASLATAPGDYKTTIQPVFLQAQSVVLLQVSLNIGLTPTEVWMNTQSSGWNPSTSIPFTVASGSFTNGETSSVFVHELTEQDFTDHVTNYDPLWGLGNLGNSVFQWAWDAVLGFINQIPIIGPLFISAMSLMGTVMTTAFYWLTFIIINFPAILLGCEVLILLMSVINARGKRFKKLGSIGGNLLRYNTMFVMGIVWFVTFCIDGVRTIIDTVVGIIQALKPI